MTDRLYVTTLRTRKRCVCCSKMVEAGTRAVLRTFTRQTSVGFMPGGYIGQRTAQRTHAAHVACAEQSPRLLGRESFSDTGAR